MWALIMQRLPVSVVIEVFAKLLAAVLISEPFVLMGFMLIGFWTRAVVLVFVTFVLECYSGSRTIVLLLIRIAVLLELIWLLMVCLISEPVVDMKLLILTLVVLKAMVLVLMTFGRLVLGSSIRQLLLVKGSMLFELT